jgi:hypothetical protein
VYTPKLYHGVGRALLVSMLDLYSNNPCSRIPNSKYRTLDKVRETVSAEINMSDLAEYFIADSSDTAIQEEILVEEEEESDYVMTKHSLVYIDGVMAYDMDVLPLSSSSGTS